MIKTTQPALHGDQHCPDGSDPIPCLITAPGELLTYPDAVLAHACLAHYWPADETTGSLVDRKGSWDMTIDTADVSGVTYPQYGAVGPFTELPELTAIVNAGDFGVGPADDGRFLNNFGSASFWTGAHPFTVELWIYLTSYGTGGSPTILQADLFQMYVSSHQLRATRGAVTVSDTVDCPLNAWQYVVLRFDGTNLDLIRNAALVDTDTAGSVNISTTLAWLNNTTGPSWSPFNGRSCQLALYDCALTDAEIVAHYDLRDTGTTSSAGLVLQTDGEGGTVWAQVGPDALEDTTVTPGSYGDSTHVAQFTVDQDGRLTAAANVAISGGGFNPATATTWWFPLADSDGLLVLDDNLALIPTLIPL